MLFRFMSITDFNPRSLAGATSNKIVKFITTLYFNPRSLAGATQMQNLKLLAAHISIHAPSRERLLRYALNYNLELISIHAPSRERLPMRRITAAAWRFQSTLPRGSDGLVPHNTQPVGSISIHAPSRERLAAEMGVDYEL